MSLAPIALVIAIASASAGCAAAQCFGAKDDEKYDSCVASAKAADEAEREREREEQRRYDEYVAARKPCERRDALACLTVAAYGAKHDGNPAQVIGAYLVACEGKIAAACVGAGEYANGRGDVVTALASHRRGCELRDSRGCVAAAALDRENAMALETTACELRDHAACYRVGMGHLAAGQRAEAERFLALACRNGETDACHQLGRIDIEAAP